VEFRIADTFTDSLARLTGEEQSIVKTTAFDLQLNPANPGMSFHRLEKGKDKNFWSVRVNSDIRLIVHRSDSSLLLCYVDHHDKAYQWAERRKLETHPKTGAAQLVEIRERVQEVTIPVYVQTQLPLKTQSPIFARISDDQLLNYGVPVEWLNDVRQATEDSLLELTDHLPSEASEALLELATGGKPSTQRPAKPQENPFEHPDAQRRFRVMKDVEELTRALEAPWDKWTVFLHPAQQQWIERDYTGPARISGSAGTGKTIVALHRAVFLVRNNPNARVLLTTFSDILANALRTRLNRLISHEPRLAERLEVHAINDIGQRLYRLHLGPPKIATREDLREALKAASAKVPSHKFTLAFLYAEWEQVVDAWQVTDWAGYRDVARLGRKTRLPEPQRLLLWSIFEHAQTALSEQGLITWSGLFTKLAATLKDLDTKPFEFAVVDEAQDLTVANLRFLSALGSERPNGLFFAGDLGQRIFQQPFSWLALGVDIRGRSRTLRVNYRTSHQIRRQADRLLDPEVSDVDGNVEDRSQTVSVFNGPKPTIQVLKNELAEQETVRAWISEKASQGLLPHEFGIFVRSATELKRACAAVQKTGILYKVLDEQVKTAFDHISISTMHLAKGLEFRAVVVMACDDAIVPLQERIESVGDDADLKEVYETERHLLYVACTRARDYLLVTSVAPASEFLDDLAETPPQSQAYLS